MVKRTTMWSVYDGNRSRQIPSSPKKYSSFDVVDTPYPNVASHFVLPESESQMSANPEEALRAAF